MARRKKHPNLPNGYGSIRYLGKNRRNPYAVHPPSTETDNHGNYLRPKALCYVDDWYIGFAVLNAYHAGTYQAGDEIKFKQYKPLDDFALDDFCRRLLTDFSARSHADAEARKKGRTFAEVYEAFYDWKFGENAKKKLSKNSERAVRAAYKNCAILHDKVFVDLRHADLQGCIDACPLRSASIENIVFLIKQMYKYAMLYELCDRDYSGSLSAPAPDDEHGIPFADEELQTLWLNQEDCVVEFVLIMCYSGYRIAAYKTLSVHLDEGYFQGGVKTAAGKNRIVPIHSGIVPLVKRRIRRDGEILKLSISRMSVLIHDKLKELGIAGHTPHDCRHTFSALCERYGVSENDRKRMLGHSFGGDITNGIYGHRSLEELRTEIEKIPCDHLVSSGTKY